MTQVEVNCDRRRFLRMAAWALAANRLEVVAAESSQFANGSELGPGELSSGTLDSFGGATAWLNSQRVSWISCAY
jgi:hypothetical protein